MGVVLSGAAMTAMADYVDLPQDSLSEQSALNIYRAPSVVERQLRKRLADIDQGIRQANAEAAAAQQQYAGGGIQYAQAERALLSVAPDYPVVQRDCNMGYQNACIRLQQLQIHVMPMLQQINAAMAQGQQAVARYQAAVAQHNQLVAQHMEAQQQLALEAGRARFSSGTQAVSVSDVSEALVPLVQQQIQAQSGNAGTGAATSVDKLAVQNLLFQMTGVRDCLGDQAIDFLRSTRNFNSSDWRSSSAVTTAVGLFANAFTNRSVCGGITAD